MTWFWLGLATACARALEDVFLRLAGKRLTPLGVQPVVLWKMTWWLRVWALPLLLLYLFGDLFVRGEGIGSQVSDWKVFGKALAIAGGLNVLAGFFYVGALAHAPVHLVTPLSALNPLLVAGSAWWIVGEMPTFSRMLGIFLITGGILLVYMGEIRKDSSSSFGRRENPIGKGWLWMLGVVVCWTFTAPYDRVGLSVSTPAIWSVSLHLAITAGLTLGMILIQWKEKKLPETFPFSDLHVRSGKFSMYLFLAGVFSALMLIFHMEGLSRAPSVAGFLALKRLSIILGTMMAMWITKEKPTALQWVGVIFSSVGAGWLHLAEDGR